MGSLSHSPEIPYFDITVEECRKYKWANPYLISAQIMSESSFNHEAVSHVGAIGLLQIMPTTATWMGVKDIDNLFIPEINIMWGIYYDDWCYRWYDKRNNYLPNHIKLWLMFIAYHDGVGNVGKWLKQDSYFPGEVALATKWGRLYLKNIMRYYSIYLD